MRRRRWALELAWGLATGQVSWLPLGRADRCGVGWLTFLRLRDADASWSPRLPAPWAPHQACTRGCKAPCPCHSCGCAGADDGE
jgi:hypothetical protein